MKEASKSSDGQEKTFRQMWNTCDVRQSERFSYFREGVCQALLSLSPEMPIERPFHARLERLELSQGFVSRIDVTPHCVSRTRSDIAAMSTEYVSLSMQQVGINGMINGQTYKPVPGDITLLDLSKAASFEMLDKGHYGLTVVVFNKALLSNSLGSRNFLLLGRDSLPALRSCLCLLEKRFKDASKPEMTSLFNAAVSLLNSELIRDREYLEDSCSKETASRTAIFDLIKSFAHDNITDPNLSTAVVADHFGISPRYVQKILAGDGLSFKAYVTNLRMEQIRNDLLSDLTTHISIADIAFRWGFRDIGTFHRNFKSRFGDTPAQMRRLLGRVAQGHPH